MFLKKILIGLSIVIMQTKAFAVFSKSENVAELNYPNYNAEYEDCAEIKDPYEKVNRKIFVFNSFLDYILLQPVAKSYKILTPNFAQNRVGNFVENLTTPVTIINNVAQLKLKDTVKSTWRFVINTTIGIGGLFDVATKMGITSTPQTFGSTLARYGVGPGPYLIVPFFGSTNGRDITDIVALDKIDPLRYNMNSYQKNGATALSMVHSRAVLLPVTDDIAKNSADPYAAIRSLTHQKRENTLRYPANYKKCKR